MNAKWYFSALIVILAFSGANQYQAYTPNQEIVVQFTDIEVTSDDAQNAIATVKEQLQVIGVNHIEVIEEVDGSLRITYYSDADVDSIKELLSKEEKLKLGLTSFDQEQQTEFPSGKNTDSFNLDIHEIQDNTDSDWDLEGISIAELKSEHQRIFNSNVYANVDNIDDSRIVAIAFKVYVRIEIVIDDSSYKIPEVRAGPAC